MTSPAAQQINAIHAMLAAGHRNLRIERHSLLIWGLPAGLLFALSPHIFTPEQLPDLQQRALAWLALLIVVVVSAASMDRVWTGRAKAARDEAWSFVHRQVQKVWWLLMGLAVLTTFAMFFYGGGYMLYAVWLVMLGLSLYLHGLFSEELLEWTGIATIFIGIGSLVAQLPHETMRWIAAAVFGLGLPLLAAMLDRGQHRPYLFRLGQMLLWLALMLLAPLSLVQYLNALPPIEAETLSLDDFRRGQGQQVGYQSLTLPAGTPVPVDIELDGDIFRSSDARLSLPLVLDRPVELLLLDGKPTGDARFGGESWQSARQVRWLTIPWIKAELTPEKGPVVFTSLIVKIRQH